MDTDPEAAAAKQARMAVIKGNRTLWAEWTDNTGVTHEIGPYSNLQEIYQALDNVPEDSRAEYVTYTWKDAIE